MCLAAPTPEVARHVKLCESGHVSGDSQRFSNGFTSRKSHSACCKGCLGSERTNTSMPLNQPHATIPAFAVLCFTLQPDSLPRPNPSVDTSPEQIGSCFHRTPPYDPWLLYGKTLGWRADKCVPCGFPLKPHLRCPADFRWRKGASFLCWLSSKDSWDKKGSASFFCWLSFKESEPLPQK